MTIEEERQHRLGLVGLGIGGSLSPVLHTDEARAQGMASLQYTLLDLTDLGRGVRETGEVVREAVADGFTGLNVTHPCKHEVLAVLDHVDPHAAMLGAVNTVVAGPLGLTGHNTDFTGFADAVRRRLADAPRDEVVLTGAGGAGAAVAHALAVMGARHVVVVDPDASRAEELAASVRERHPGVTARAASPGEVTTALRTADGLVNASPIGMHGHPGSPVPPVALRPEHWVADIVYRPLETELLREARRRGCRTMDGVDMLVGQAADAFALMTGVRADVDRMHRSIRGRLGGASEHPAAV